MPSTPAIPQLSGGLCSLGFARKFLGSLALVPKQLLGQVGATVALPVVRSVNRLKTPVAWSRAASSVRFWVGPFVDAEFRRSHFPDLTRK